MAIKVEEITTDITLELDEEAISIPDYKKATESFLDLVKEVSNQVSGDKKSGDKWLVKVYSGSAGIGVSPSGSYLSSDKVREIIISGIKSLANAVRPIAFTDKAIEHAKTLASLFKKTKAEPNVRLWSKTEESVRIGRKIALVADSFLSASYQEDGAVEGVLETVEGHGKLEFCIYDVIDNRKIACEINKSLLPFALSNFQKRIEVIGKVQYRKDGMPVRVIAEKIVKFPEKSEIPTVAQMRALLSGEAA